MPSRSSSWQKRSPTKRISKRRKEDYVTKSESKYFNTAEKMSKAFFSVLEKKDYEYITIKDICMEAKVNRSTFYLHYETMDDLLEESVGRKIQELSSYMNPKSLLVKEKILTSKKEDLNLITPEYLIPYLNYVKDNRRVFLLFLEKSDTLKLERLYQGMVNDIFLPILDRFHVEENVRKYLLAFTMNGLLGIITTWLKSGCRDKTETISSVMQSMISKIDLSQDKEKAIGTR